MLYNKGFLMKEIKECIYCGSTRKIVREHMIPIIYTSISRGYIRGATVPACSVCNSLLSSKLMDYDKRCEYLIESYHKKYAKILKTPKWTEDDIKELGRNLEGRLRKDLALQKEVIKKLEVLKDRLNRCKETDVLNLSQSE